MSRIVVLGQDPGFGGGTATMVQTFLDGARALGHDAELVYLPHPSFGGRRARLDRVEALRLGRGRLDFPPGDELWVVAGAAAHGYAALRSGRPYSCWIATSLADENRGRIPGLSPSRRLAALVNAPVLEHLERRVLRGARHLLAISEASRRSLAAAAAVPLERVAILPIPVDTSIAPSEGPPEAPLLSFVARGDDPRKNVDLAVAAFELVRRDMPDARMRILSAPPSRRLPDGIEAAGRVHSIGEAVRETSLFLLTSHQEGFAVVAAEALSVGVPVVSTPSGGPEEMLRSSGAGVITRGWRAQDVADAVLELLRDPGRLREMGQRGIAYARREHDPVVFTRRLQASLDA
jgi:glycosyltransferase involved in cell wall biosynthesis